MSSSPSGWHGERAAPPRLDRLAQALRHDHLGDRETRNLVAGMDRGTVVGSFCHDQVVDAEAGVRLTAAAGFDQVVDAAGRDQVVDAAGAFTTVPLVWGEIPIPAIENDGRGASWVFMVPPPCAAGGVAGGAAAVGECVYRFSAQVTDSCNRAPFENGPDNLGYA